MEASLLASSWSLSREADEDGGQPCAQTSFCNLGLRTLLRVTGADAAKYLHNLCTQHVLEMNVGDARETFFTNVQGKILSYGVLIHRPDGYLYDAAPGGEAELLRHLAKYHIREDVSYTGLSADWGVMSIWGNAAETLLTSLGCLIKEASAIPPIEHASIIEPIPECAAVRSPWLGPDHFTVYGPVDAVHRFESACKAAGAVGRSLQCWQSLRIEKGVPLFGVDLDSGHFPQEADRDAEAIHFRKGCYLGQETIARIDALGHVNHYLRRLKWAGSAASMANLSEANPSADAPPVLSAPPVPAVLSIPAERGREPVPIEHDGKVGAQLTSLSWSANEQSWVALGRVRRGLEAAGTLIGDGENTWCVLPRR